MDLDETLRILREAKGDPARISLVSVDLLLAEHPESEREILRVALQVAAVPHWFDEKILGVLLDASLGAEAQSLASQLRRLPVVEPFPARGPGAANVHETSRVALRSWMKGESPDRLAALSERARIYFDGDAPHLRIEALYHGFTVQPEAAEQKCAMLYDEWSGMGRYKELLGLGVVLDELRTAGVPDGVVRSSVLYYLAKIRYDYQPRNITASQAREAIAEAQHSGVLWRIANATALLGNVLRDQGDLPAALAAYGESSTILKRLASLNPGNLDFQRALSVLHNNVGDVFRDKGNLPAALAAYRDDLNIVQRLAAQDPGQARWQIDLSISHDRIGDVFHQQGDLPAALAAYRTALTIRERLAAQDLNNADWQRAVSVSHNKVGDVLRDNGDLPAALVAYRRSFAIAQSFADQHTDHSGWQRDMSVLHNRIGKILQKKGDLPEALAAYRADLNIAERLAAQDPTNAQLQIDVALSYAKVAEVMLAINDDVAEARRMIALGLDKINFLGEVHSPAPLAVGVRRLLEKLRGRTQ